VLAYRLTALNGSATQELLREVIMKTILWSFAGLALSMSCLAAPV
jgi:hypothetical protein